MPGGKPKSANKQTSAVATAATTDSKAQEQQLVTDELPISINDWNTDHITIWLKNIDLTEYIEIFKTEALQGEDIISITNDQLKSIGIDKLGNRSKLYVKHKNGKRIRIIYLQKKINLSIMRKQF